MVKATFKNTGPIKSAELELGDLTIIAGQNNTGKTYLVYTLYGFLKYINEPSHWYSLQEIGGDNSISKQLNIFARQLSDSGVLSIPATQFKHLVKQYIQELSRFFSKELIHNVFSTSKQEFADAQFNLEMDVNDITDETFIPGLKYLPIDINLSFKGGRVVFEQEMQAEVPSPEDFIPTELYVCLGRFISLKSPSVFILSAERFGISLFYKELDFTKNRLVEELQKLSDGTKHFNPFEFIIKGSSRYAQPIKDNIDFTRDLARIQTEKSVLALDDHSIREMMEGYYKADSSDIRFISRRRKSNRFDIPLHLASSSARGLSDMYFYLKHVASPGELLIIDEPESHLSPTNQILMARLLAFCVNAGLKVLITTHSDYLIKEINNLVMLDNNFEGKEEFLARHKNEYTEHDRLSPDAIKAYTCEAGTLKACRIDSAGIDMPVFDDAIDKINRTSNELAFLTMPHGMQND
ncbi:MAG: AAA family ATPase [Gammaproteobacteria bacterium]|nr:AAA family ATPase [Gammaproteobacteria bacterium]